MAAGPGFFGVEGAGGYVRIEGRGIRLAGSFVISGGEEFSAASALVSRPAADLVFSHVASNADYYTGLAIVDPNGAGAGVTLEVLDAAGSVIARRTLTLPAGGRSSGLLTEYFPALAGRHLTSGYFRVTADSPVAAMAVIGTHALTALTAIPRF